MDKRILVIDDELDIRDIVCLSLEEFGHWQATGAGSGHEGLAMAQAEHWDAILLDVSMPDMDGFTVTKKLQTIPSTQSIPVILLTAKVLDDELEKFEQIGVVGIIAKPFNPVIVWQQVAEILNWPTL